MKLIIKKTKTEKGIRRVYIVAFVLLLLTYLFTLYANRELVKQAARVEYTNSIIKTLDNTLAATIDGETGVRGYLITKNIQFLFPYYGSSQITDSLYDELIQLTSDSWVQTERLRELKTSIDERLENLRYLVKTFDENEREISDSMLGLHYSAKMKMDSIRAKIALMERHENRMLVERQERMERTTRLITTITIISLTLAFSLLFFGLITYMQVSKEKKRGLQEIEDYQYQLRKRITELNKANAELIKIRSLEKLAVTGRIARAIAHEIRNPLTNINLATNQLITDLREKNTDSDFLFEMINRNSDRINHLISDLLDSTKFSELSYESIAINDLLDETLQEAADRIVLNKVEVVKDYSTGLKAVSVDKNKMKTAFLNIIINAIEAMERQDERVLTLVTKSKNNKCKIVISDTGTGMDPDSVTRLFEAYFSNKPMGIGLGLTNTQNIIHNHNGEISVESIQGKGTKFTILLAFTS